ncbi:hypothetical protein CY35_02G070800 [Sphagnum magellanicum]|nr:hypothetical protein CY35_02G070800 [Sphagnum magellanicum]
MMDSSSSSSSSTSGRLDWPPNFPVLVQNSWLVKPSCKLQGSLGDIHHFSWNSQFRNLPLTGFDMCRVKIGFILKLLLFDHHPEAVEDGGCSGEGFFNSGLASVRMRESLAKALDQCRPLAGRLVREGDGTLAIECNDSGVIFVEASSPISLEELRDDKSCYTYENFFPLDRASFQEIGSLEADAPLFGAQLTTFDKGGYAVGVMYCHAAVDGPSFAQFVSSWAEVSRTEGESLQNSHEAFDFRSRINILNLQPHMTLDSSSNISETAPSAGVSTTTMSMPPEQQQLPPTWMKQEVFPNSILVAHGPRMKPGSSSCMLFMKVKVELLKKLKSQLAQEYLADDAEHDANMITTSHATEGKNMSAAVLGNLSSYVAISALIWRASIRARSLPEEQDTQFIPAINCRTRCDNVPSNYFGNAILDAVAVTTVGELVHRKLWYAAKMIQNSLERFTTGECIQSFSNRMEREKNFAFTAKFRPERDVMVAGLIHDSLTSCDFGWGVEEETHS